MSSVQWSRCSHLYRQGAGTLSSDLCQEKHCLSLQWSLFGEAFNPWLGRCFKTTICMCFTSGCTKPSDLWSWQLWAGPAFGKQSEVLLLNDVPKNLLNVSGVLRKIRSTTTSYLDGVRIKHDFDQQWDGEHFTEMTLLCHCLEWKEPDEPPWGQAGWHAFGCHLSIQSSPECTGASYHQCNHEIIRELLDAFLWLWLGNGIMLALCLNTMHYCWHQCLNKKGLPFLLLNMGSFLPAVGDKVSTCTFIFWANHYKAKGFSVVTGLGTHAEVLLVPKRPYCQSPCHILPASSASCLEERLIKEPVCPFFCSCCPWEAMVMPFVFCILEGTATEQTKPVFWAFLPAEIKKEQNFCSFGQVRYHWEIQCARANYYTLLPH